MCHLVMNIIVEMQNTIFKVGVLGHIWGNKKFEEKSELKIPHK